MKDGNDDGGVRVVMTVPARVAPVGARVEVRGTHVRCILPDGSLAAVFRYDNEGLVSANWWLFGVDDAMAWAERVKPDTAVRRERHGVPVDECEEGRHGRR